VAKVNVAIDAYPSESDVQAVPLPANVVIEGDFQNGPNVGVNNRGDSHLLVYDVDNNVAYEFYRASRPSENTDGKWHADQETVWDMKTNTFRTLGYTSADAAGLSILVGLVRPDEALPVNQGGQGVIKHAIRFTLQNSIILDQFLYPASHVANPGNTNPAIQPPMGARFRLKASVDLSQMNPEARTIAQAMKDYGLIVADNGSNFFFSGASYAVDGNNAVALTYNDNDIQDSVHGLKSLHFSDFEVVDLTPVVTGLSATSGPAGTTVTVVGQNFSGAAGNLQVWFGNNAATVVSVIDDSHVSVVVPAGSGTVDVRVQSGQTVPADSQNVNNTIFGYGTSAVNASDRFTYSTGGGGGGGGGGGNGALAFSAAAQSFHEKNGAIVLTVLRTGGSSGTVTVEYGASTLTNLKGKQQPVLGTDVTGALTGTLTFSPGVTQASITLTPRVEDLVEEDKSFLVTLSGPTGGAVLGAQLTDTVTIVDDNLPVVPNATPSLGRLQQAGSGFGKSLEHYRQFAITAYNHYLGRTPAEPEIGYWVSLMQLYESSGHQQGLRQEQIEAGFLDSQEYLSHFGGANKAWIDGIYRDLLGRAADSTGESYWLGQLGAGVAPTQVALGFATSDERLRDRVTATYWTLLERAPDAAGLNYWVNIFKAGSTTEDINSGFAGSVEYYNKQPGATGAAGNPALWVREAYLDVLFRPAHVSELAYWLGFLNG
jgi:hypothetical protein